MHPQCLFEGHDWQRIGEGDFGGAATFAPYRCSRCTHEELRTEVDASPPVAAVAVVLLIVFGALSALLYRLGVYLQPLMR